MKKVLILMGILLIPIFFIVLNNTGRGTIAKDNIVFRDKLSDYNLFKGKIADLVPNDQGISYELASTLFTDYTDKKRVIFLPRGKKMIASDDGLPSFPDGTLIAKTFFYPQKDAAGDVRQQLLETRLLIYKDGQWNAATYQWNAAQDEALLLMDSASVHVSFLDSKGDERQTNYIIPSRNDCMACHRQGNQLFPICPKIRNLNRIIGHDGDSIQQLVQLTKQGALDLKSFKSFTNLPSYDDLAQSTASRARAYLEINCAHCHNPKGTAYMTMLDLRYESPMHETGIWLKQAKIIGRMSTLGEMHMPQKGTTVLHDEGILLIKTYLKTLK
ncbi:MULTISPECIES: hypothetical protein [Sphingobacterium]|uniref:Cytochrome c domain-containing protein n=2 Tax=Sphingobacterium TaxID=28453 RepID=A0A2X2IRC1_SPHMU|nr:MULTISPECIES: hypothetical protein [Sphingobacterium]OFV10132.1 hypothetical protein HMPREF3127_22300 [Sphingobacterium sp. HMSC13C05]QRQ59405.1 hypothetical protein I6J33_14485 [Sphingobacterium multivorum]SPZ84812.1 Uncharacterised protein [Sphingobacterium multivorum]HCX56918.1 hypothetical protein [Sphingobacterium sp.]